MSTVAEQLRAAREAKKMTLEQVATATKIRTDLLAALESGDFSMFSAPIYIRGSVKNFATVLKLDVPQIMAALDIELKATEKFSEPPPLSDVTKTQLDNVMFWLAKLNLKAVLAAVALLGILLIFMLVNAVLKHGKKNNPQTGLPPAVYQPANSGDTLPLPKK